MALLTTALWRPLPVMTLTIRQFLGGKAVRVVTVLSLVPCLFAGIYLLRSHVRPPKEFLVSVLFRGIYAPSLLPILVLILATAALGNEVEDRTLPYLMLKPISRLRLVAEKLVGVLLVALPTTLLGLLVSFLMVEIGAGDQPTRIGRLVFTYGPPENLWPILWAMLAAAAIGVVALSAIFLLVSLIIPRALLVGMLYSFVWESLLGRFLPGVRVVSVRHYVVSAFVDILNDPQVTLDHAYDLPNVLLVVAGIVVVCVGLCTWRLRTMNIE